MIPVRLKLSGADRDAVLLYLPAALSLAFLDHRVRRFSTHVVTDFIPSVMAGSSGAPAKYRVLMPLLHDRLQRWTGGDPYIVFLSVELAAIYGALLAMHFYLRNWYGARPATAGVLAAAAMMPLTFVNQYAMPDTFPDLVLFTLGCFAVATRRDLALGAVLLAGMLNRETTGFLLLLWAADRIGSGGLRQHVVRGLALAGVVLCVYVSVRWLRGYESYRLFMLMENISMLKTLPAGFDPYTRVAGYFWLALFGPAAVFAVRGARRPDSPPFFKAALLTGGVLLIVVWLFAAIIEVRVLVPLFPLILPAALHHFANFRCDGEGEPRERWRAHVT